MRSSGDAAGSASGGFRGRYRGNKVQSLGSGKKAMGWARGRCPRKASFPAAPQIQGGGHRRRKAAQPLAGLKRIRAKGWTRCLGEGMESRWCIPGSHGFHRAPLGRTTKSQKKKSAFCPPKRRCPARPQRSHHDPLQEKNPVKKIRALFHLLRCLHLFPPPAPAGALPGGCDAVYGTGGDQKGMRRFPTPNTGLII